MKLPLCLAMLAAATMMFAQDEDRAKLIGAWESGEQSGETHSVWTFESQGSSMHITNSFGDRKLSEFVCQLAKECKVKDAGKSVTVMMYFNGAKLVMQETRGEEVFKRRFGVAEPNVLEVEMIPVVPDGKAETTRFTRMQTTAVNSAK